MLNSIFFYFVSFTPLCIILWFILAMKRGYVSFITGLKPFKKLLTIYLIASYSCVFILCIYLAINYFLIGNIEIVKETLDCEICDTMAVLTMYFIFYSFFFIIKM